MDPRRPRAGLVALARLLSSPGRARTTYSPDLALPAVIGVGRDRAVVVGFLDQIVVGVVAAALARPWIYFSYPMKCNLHLHHEDRPISKKRPLEKQQPQRDSCQPSLVTARLAKLVDRILHRAHQAMCWFFPRRTRLGGRETRQCTLLNLRDQ